MTDLFLSISRSRTLADSALLPPALTHTLIDTFTHSLTHSAPLPPSL